MMNPARFRQLAVTPAEESIVQQIQTRPGASCATVFAPCQQKSRSPRYTPGKRHNGTRKTIAANKKPPRMPVKGPAFATASSSVWGAVARRGGNPHGD